MSDRLIRGILSSFGIGTMTTSLHKGGMVGWFVIWVLSHANNYGYITAKRKLHYIEKAKNKTS